ncbi:MAG: LysE family transporter [Bacteroidales bacterium]|nr:LysE family transporter [Bacteroidales bacterium]
MWKIGNISRQDFCFVGILECLELYLTVIMYLVLFIKGLILGVAVSAPLGPMAMIVVQRSLNSGRKHGLLSGVGVAASDISYAIIAAFGLSVIIGFILNHQIPFKLIGATVLILVGLKFGFSDPVKMKRKALRRQSNGNPLTVIGEMYLMTLTNPASLFLLGAAFAGFGIIQHETSSISIFIMLLGVALGTLIWWVFLTWILSLLKKRIRLRHLFWINRIVGIVIIVIGLSALASVFLDDFIIKI